ncbi:hypothetical protein COV82_05330 [Candidatus Peregrinibacteria bacterium CG11_big_fil_rev_8_21_14_0_20_46_8]|nr:MAG: hypothetical protein COV82_05330 [Candidatus Peregrinibacteria bacterium CG11_big_fil_rev_8_21_14_0_20_46_8]
MNSAILFKTVVDKEPGPPTLPEVRHRIAQERAFAARRALIQAEARDAVLRKSGKGLEFAGEDWEQQAVSLLDYIIPRLLKVELEKIGEAQFVHKLSSPEAALQFTFRIMSEYGDLLLQKIVASDAVRMYAIDKIRDTLESLLAQELPTTKILLAYLKIEEQSGIIIWLHNEPQIDLS